MFSTLQLLRCQCLLRKSWLDLDNMWSRRPSEFRHRRAISLPFLIPQKSGIELQISISDINPKFVIPSIWTNHRNRLFWILIVELKILTEIGRNWTVKRKWPIWWNWTVPERKSWRWKWTVHFWIKGPFNLNFEEIYFQLCLGTNQKIEVFPEMKIQFYLPRQAHSPDCLYWL